LFTYSTQVEIWLIYSARYYVNKRLRLTLLTILGLASSLCADVDLDLDKLMSMSLDELLEIEITSSTYSKEDMSSVPSSVTVFTYNQIQKMSVNSLEELMNYVPGFQASRGDVYTNQSTAYVRGKYTGSGQKDILVLLDGQRLNNEWSGTALDYNRLVSLENVQRIEFIKGPGSALYGTSAFLGVINIFTKTDLNNVGTRVGDDYVNGYLNYTYNEEDLRVNTFVKGLYDGGQEYSLQKDLYTQAYRNPKDKNTGSELYVNGEYNDFSFQFRHQRRDADGWYILALNSDQSESTVEQEFMRFGYVYDELSDYVSQFYSSYMWSEQKGTLAGAPFRTKVDINDEALELQWLNSYDINRKNNISFGAEYRHPKVTKANIEQVEGLTPTVPLAKLNSRDIYGLYAQYQGHFSDFTFTVGGRYDDYSDSGSSFNPRLAVVYQPLETTSIKLLYGSAFRAPVYNELYYTGSNGEVVGNPDLDPEKIDTYEAILVQTLGSSSLNLSYFYSRIKDTIEEVRNASDLLVSVNAGDEDFSGVEAELFSQFLHNNLNTRLGITHITKSDQRVQVTPKTSVSGITNYRYEKFNFNLSGYYHSSAENDYGTYVKTLDAYWLVNTKISYKILPELRVYFEMQNIFDEEYYTPSASPSASKISSSTARGFDIENRGRLSYLGLEYSF